MHFVFRLPFLAAILAMLAIGPVQAAKRQMIVAAHPAASAAGYEMLRRGGSAVDAAIAAQMVLTLVEPQSSGIGGGAFLVHWNAASKEVLAFDGRETAPAAADGGLFLMPDGTRMKWREARIGGRSVGVPGTVRMLALAHQEHGKLPWASLFDPAIALAANGFPVSPRLHQSIASQKGWEKTPSSNRYFLNPQGEAWPAGHILKNQALAETFRALAADPNALNEGAIAEEIVAAVQGFAANPGLLSVEDLAGYQPKVRPAVCGAFLAYSLCGMPPPSSGPVTVLMMLGMAENLGAHRLAPDSAEWAHLFAEVGKIAFADRNEFLADPDFVHQPVMGLLDAGYLRSRAALVDQSKAGGKASAGDPPRKEGARFAPHEGLNEHGTSHLSVVDAAGNIVSMTTTIESAFGSRLMVRGFLLNNELTDFSFLPEKDGKPIANRVEPGKRPRSSMAPMIAFGEDGEPVLAFGSPGGSRIIGFVAGAALRILGNGMSPQAAVEAGHVINRNSATTEVEEGRVPGAIAERLQELGHTLKPRTITSGSHIIMITGDGLVAGVDPRREGLALGD